MAAETTRPNVTVTVNGPLDTPSGQALEAVVDADIDGFDQFFQGLGNEQLSGPERAAIKTYLWWKTHPEATRG